MQALNHALFLWINPQTSPQPLMLTLALLCGRYLVYLAPVLAVSAWSCGGALARRATVQAGMAAVLATLLGYAVGLIWPEPRPFMLGLGHQWLAHARNPSFPSHHLSFWWSVSLALLWLPSSRRLGLALTLLGLPMAWARIYLGLHFPMDMAGAALIAAISAPLAHGLSPFYVAPLVQADARLRERLRGWRRSRRARVL